MKHMKIIILILLIIGLTHSRMKRCTISKYMKSSADIEIISVKTTPRYNVKRGQIVTSMTKFRLNSGTITSGKFRCAVLFSGMRFRTYEIFLNKKNVGKSLPLEPGVYTVTLSEFVPGIAPLGVYSSRTNFYVNGKITACFLKNIKVNK